MNYDELYPKVEACFMTDEHAVARFEHVKSVIKMALEIQDKYLFDIDVEKLKIAALLHDFAKSYPPEKVMSLLPEYFNEEEVAYYNKYPKIAHAPLAAKLVQEKFGINDPVILNAIAYHTTGNVNMDLLSQVIYAADAVERTRNYEGVDNLRETILQDFDKGFVAILKRTIDVIKARNMPISSITQAIYDYYKEKYENK